MYYHAIYTRKLVFSCLWYAVFACIWYANPISRPNRTKSTHD